MKNKIVSTLAGILLAGSVAGCVTEPNYTGAAYALRNISASGKALNGKSLTYEHQFQRERDNSSRREYAPDKEFYTALCKDSNRNGKITGDECLIKKNSFSNDETFAILLTDRASHKGTKSSIDVYDSNNAFLEHLESIKSADIVSICFPAYTKKFPSGIYKAYLRTNGVLDGALEFEIVNDLKPQKEFYTSVWKDLNQDKKITEDEVFEKKNFFSKDENVSVNIVDRGSPVGSSVQIDVYCPNGNLAVTSKSLYKKSSPLQEDISGVGLPDVLVNNCGYGKYRVTRKTNGVLDGEIDFHILSEDKSYL